MIGSQFQPWFLLRHMRPHPLFMGLIKAAKEKSKKTIKIKPQKSSLGMQL
jgi:CTP synthase (UTP-ammonia lyase)